MSKKSKKNVIVGPEGTEYPVAIIDKQIVRRDRMVRKVIALAHKLSEYVQAVNLAVVNDVQGHLDKTAEAHRQTWQGNTVLKTFDGTMAIEVDIQMQKSYDENLQVASSIINKWLDSKLEAVKDPAARKVFEQVNQIAKTALRIDHKGNVDQAKLIQLRKFEFSQEPEWQEAMDLISKSEQVTGTKRYIRFKAANPETGKLESIPVDFSKF